METSKARVDVDGVFLNVNVDIGPGTITNVAGYRFQRSRLPNSTTGMGSIVAPDGDELALFDLNRSDNRKTWQEELRFRSEEHTSELQSLMRISYAVFCLKKKTIKYLNKSNEHTIDLHATTIHTKKVHLTTNTQ